HAGAERGQEHADLPAPEPLLIADHDDGQQHPGTDEIGEAVQEGSGAQEWLAPQELEALTELRAHGRRAWLAGFLKRGSHQDERNYRENIGRRISEERNAAADPECRTPERAAGGPPVG